ncbi:hypothetical protein MTO96_036422 [Rhipicephalus appendiculatus]
MRWEASPIAHEAGHRLLHATAAEKKGTDPRIAASARRHASSVNNEVISLEPVAAVGVGSGWYHQNAKYTPCRGRKTLARTACSRWRQRTVTSATSALRNPSCAPWIVVGFQ